MPNAQVSLVGTHWEDIVEQRLYVRLGPAAARLNVRKQSFEVPNLTGDVLHLPDRLLHLSELLRHTLECRLQSFLERRLKWLVDRLPHLVQLGLVAATD